MKTVPLRLILAAAHTKGNPQAYIADCHGAGKLIEDAGKQYLVFDDADYRRIQKRHAMAGAGDLVASVAKPIARMVDKAFGTDLEHCGGCEQRRAALNRALPFS